MYKKEDFFQVIGHVSVFFSTLDVLTSILISELVKKSVANKPKYDDTLGIKFRFLKGLNNEDVNSVKTLKKLNGLIDEAIKISDERNRYIHDLWVFDDKNIRKGYIDRLRMKGTNKIGFEKEVSTLSINDLYVFLKGIGNMQESIGKMIKNKGNI
ncbi:MAG: hypothetical protein ABIE68_04600 [bacterium]